MHSHNYATLTLSGQRGMNIGMNYLDKSQYITSDKSNTYKIHDRTDYLKQQTGILLNNLDGNLETNQQQHQQSQMVSSELILLLQLVLSVYKRITTIIKYKFLISIVSIYTE